MGQVNLYVDNEDSTGAWTTEGSPPYLSTQNQPTDYIHSTGRNSDSGVYSFPSSSDLGTITAVHLFIYAYSVAVDDFDAMVSGQNAGNAGPGGSWQWVDIDVSSIITTWAQVNAATIYFDRPNTTNDAGVDAAYLQVTYTEGDLQPSVSDSISSSEGLGRSLPLPGVLKTGSITLGELLKLLKSIAPNLYSNVTLVELVDVFLKLNINILDSISTDDIALALIDTMFTPVFDVTSVDEYILIMLKLLGSVSDISSIVESIQAQLSDATGIDININDATLLLENLFAKISISTSISDLIGISEIIVTRMMISSNVLNQSVIAEFVNLSIGLLHVSLSISDTIGIIEQMLARILISAFPSSTTNVGDTISMIMNLSGIGLYSAVTVVERAIAGMTVPNRGVLTGLVSFKAPRMQFAVSNGA